MQAYGEFDNKVYTDGDVSVESKVFDNEFFGYNKVTVESPLKDENGELILNKKGQKQADAELKDTEDIPLTEDIGEYFAREVLPFNSDAWIDKKKTKIGFEIPFTRLFYKYQAPEKSDDISAQIKDIEERIIKNFEALSGQDVEE